MTEVQIDLIEPMKLNSLQIGERAQRLCDALAERDLLVVENKRAAAATKEAIEGIDKTISRLRAEIRESRPTGTVTFLGIDEVNCGSRSRLADEAAPEVTE